jgi:capsular exopolysaccharide family
VNEPSTSSPDRLNLRNRLVDREFSLLDLVRLLWRRRGLIVGTVALCVALALAALFTATPQYTGTTQILIDTKEPKIATSLEEVISESTPDKEAINSQIAVLKSWNLGEKIVDDYQLTRDPEFNAALRPPSALQIAVQGVRSFIVDLIPPDLLAKPDDGEDKSTQEHNDTVSAFIDDIAVTMVGQSRVIQIDFEAEDSAKAAKLANAIADAYLLSNLEAKYDATRRANQWLSSKLDDIRQKVSESDAAVEAYRQRAGLLRAAATGSTLISQQVTDLNAQLIGARADRAAAEARLDQVKQAIKSANGAETLADVLGSPIIVDIVRQETEVKRRIAELADELGDRHPRMISARNELSDVQAKARIEVNKIIKKLENEAGIARAREASLQRSLTQLEGKLAQANSAEVQLRALEQDAEANKTTLQQFLSRASDLSAQSDLSAHDISARVIARATPPTKPSSPRKVLILAVVLVLSTAIAVLLAFALETLDRGFRSGDQVEDATGVRTLGLVPALTTSKRKAGGPENYIVDNPSSMFAESIRSVYTSVLISYSRPAPRTVLVTSSQPKEGKSTICACLARMCAISGKKTIVVESDLRRPSVHKLMGVPQVPGLVEYYRGEATLEEVMHKDEATGAYVVPAGKLAVDPVKVLGSLQVRQLFAELAQQFDLVVVDSPPLMAVADARILAPDVDATVFVVRWGRTNREVVRLGLKTLLETGANLSGVVLSRVDAKRHAQYGFGDSGYYYKGVKQYYTR